MTDLSKGLFVENLKILIPWGITNEEAWRVGNAKPWNLPEDKTRIKWDPAVIFGGMECVVQTWFPTDQFRLSKFNILDAHDDQHSPKVWADQLIARCEAVFGNRYEGELWLQNDVMVRLCFTDRFTEAYWLEILREAV